MPLSLPGGFTASGIDVDADIPAIVELCNAAAIAEDGTPELDAHVVRESYASPGFDPRRDGLLIRDASGRLVAVAEYYDDDEAHVAPYVYLRFPPGFLDEPDGNAVARAVMAWADERGEETVGHAAPDVRVAIRAAASARNEPVQAVLTDAGYEFIRTGWTMEIELGEAPPEPPSWPEGIAVRTAVRGVDEPAVHAATEDAFSDHFGFLPQPYEDWLHFATKLDVYDPELWFLAVDGDEIAGIALCLAERPGNPGLGWVSTLGVRRRWRRRGLGEALLRHGFRELHARGLRRVGLGVDAQSLTGATRLYERVGMRVVVEHRQYERELRPGRELRTVALAADPVG